MSGASSGMVNRKKRPKFLNLTAIRMPLPAVVSIMHRMSGGLLFLLMPWLIALFGLSLSSPEGYHKARSIAGNPVVALILFGLAWAYLHHFCAGIRFLLLDLQIGLEKQAAFRSAVAVLVVSLTLTLLLAARILGVF